MGGRGTFASGNNVAYTYKTVGKINGVKVLQPQNSNNALKLPEESHSSIQGWVKNNNFTLVLDQMEPEPPNPTPYVPLWTMTKPYDKRADVVEALLAAPIWDNKTFWEAESEIEWIDC